MPHTAAATLTPHPQPHRTHTPADTSAPAGVVYKNHQRQAEVQPQQQGGGGQQPAAARAQDLFAQFMSQQPLGSRSGAEGQRQAPAPSAAGSGDGGWGNRGKAYKLSG